MHLIKISSIFFFILFLGSASFANDCKLTEFKQFAENLDKTKIESVEQLADKYRELTSNQSQNCASQLFGEFRSYYFQFMEGHEISLAKSLCEYPIPDNLIDDINAKLYMAGWEIIESEGSYSIGENSNWLLENFSSSLPKDWQKFLQQRKNEIENKFSEDARLLITWDELRNRIIYWENFSNEFPSFNEKNTVEYYLSIYLRTYLTGIDNSRIYDWATSKVEPEVIESYKNYLKLNQQSKYYKIIENQYKILQTHDFTGSEKVTEELDALHKLNNIESMLAVQPPIY
ncbi:MAG: hypothetical protein KKB51_24975 [Candidatus Riflebacteria bacterium]|nr:hypothetical protein [Candidatus Riflebacteria bacterium]